MAGPVGGAEFSFPLLPETRQPTSLISNAPPPSNSAPLVLESTGNFSLADFIQEMLNTRTGSTGGIGTSSITLTGPGGDSAQFSPESLLASLPSQNGSFALPPPAGVGAAIDFFA